MSKRTLNHVFVSMWGLLPHHSTGKPNFTAAARMLGGDKADRYLHKKLATAYERGQLPPAEYDFVLVVKARREGVDLSSVDPQWFRHEKEREAAAA